MARNIGGPLEADSIGPWIVSGSRVQEKSQETLHSTVIGYVVPRDRGRGQKGRQRPGKYIRSLFVLPRGCKFVTSGLISWTNIDIPLLPPH